MEHKRNLTWKKKDLKSSLWSDCHLGTNQSQGAVSSDLTLRSSQNVKTWHLHHCKVHSKDWSIIWRINPCQSRSLLISYQFLIGKKESSPLSQALTVVSVKTYPKWYQRWQFLQIWHPHCKLTHFRFNEKTRSYSWVWLPCPLKVREAFLYEFIANLPNVTCIFRWLRNWYKPNNFLNLFQLHKIRVEMRKGREIVST